MNDCEKIPREDSLMLRSSALLNETTELWPETTVLWFEKHKNTQNTQRKRERSSEAAIIGAILVAFYQLYYQSSWNVSFAQNPGGGYHFCFCTFSTKLFPSTQLLIHCSCNSMFGNSTLAMNFGGLPSLWRVPVIVSWTFVKSAYLPHDCVD
ncbi:hypothetical protein AMECASPLE_030126 [Ameca splendens]|uniref:Uncharacterized protein n=1 Tax=Ameca splendens TaxID=208324 RepID=A0ABV1AFI9_9TELE